MKAVAGKWIEFGKGSVTWDVLVFPFRPCDEQVRLREEMRVVEQ